MSQSSILPSSIVFYVFLLCTHFTTCSTWFQWFANLVLCLTNRTNRVRGDSSSSSSHPFHHWQLVLPRCIFFGGNSAFKVVKDGWNRSEMGEGIVASDFMTESRERPGFFEETKLWKFSCDLWGIYIPATKTLLFAINLVCLTPWSYNLSWAKRTVQCWTAMSLAVNGQDCQLRRLRRLAQIRPAAARHGLALSALYGGAVRFLRGQSQQMSEESLKHAQKENVWSFHHLNENISVIFFMIFSFKVSALMFSHVALVWMLNGSNAQFVTRSNGDVVNQRPRPRLGKLPARTFGRLRVEGAFFQQLVPVENEIDSDMW